MSPEWEFFFFYFFEFFPVVFFFWVDEKLAFGLREFPASENVLSWRDFVSVCFPDLEDAEWEFSFEVIVESLVWEVCYRGCFWSERTFGSCDICFHH